MSGCGYGIGNEMGIQGGNEVEWKEQGKREGRFGMREMVIWVIEVIKRIGENEVDGNLTSETFLDNICQNLTETKPI